MKNDKIINKNNEKLINIFNQLYLLHQVLENKYEARSYKNIVEILKKYPKKIKSSKNLENIPGIGNRTLLKVNEIITTGNLKLLRDLKKNKNIIARLELQSILGIGPKFAKKLVEKYNIKSIKQLKSKFNNGDIDLTHMQQIGLKYYNKLNEKIPRNEITKFKNNFIKLLNKKFHNIDIIMAGSYRRGKKTSGDIDIIIVDSNIKTLKELNKSNIFDDIIEYLINNKILIEIINRSKNNIMAITNTKRHIDIKISPYNLLPFYLLYFGSGEKFSRNIRQKAKEKGYKLSEFGLFNSKTNKIIMNKANNEKHIFNKLNIQFIKPENR